METLTLNPTIALYGFLLSWFISHFEPWMDFIVDLSLKSWAQRVPLQFWTLLSCWKCQSLWITYILSITATGSLSPFNAFLASFTVWILEKIIPADEL